MTETAEVYMWGTRIGIAHQNRETGLVSFEYDRGFLRSGIELSPLYMPLSERVYSFPELPRETFRGVPGLLSDSLPDKFGNAVIERFLTSRGRAASSLNVIERLCYTGKRGMGALEYVPALGTGEKSEQVDVDELVNLANEVLKKREEAELSSEKDFSQSQLLKLGTSAGGARAKAIIAWNEKTGEIRSGQIPAGKDFGYWLIKFDGVGRNGDHDLTDEPEYTLIEYVYSLLTRKAGIAMQECRILEENGRHHFMTRRFDRLEGGEKLHMQTLGALAHLDFNSPGQSSYEQAAAVARRLGLSADEMEQLFRRMVFNVLLVNQDDHVKNISFLMDRRGKWSLAPAYDMTFSYNPENRWLRAHQMLINGHSAGISREDLLAAASSMDLRREKADRIVDEILAVADSFFEEALSHGIRENTAAAVREVLAAQRKWIAKT